MTRACLQNIAGPRCQWFAETTSKNIIKKLNRVKNQEERGNLLGGAALGRLAALLLSHLGTMAMLLRRALPASPNPPRATQHYFEDTP
jgi:hypothetical protein